MINEKTKQQKREWQKTNRTAYINWLDFATRLVKYVYQISSERKKKMIENVTEYIQTYKGCAIHGWDSGVGDSVDDYFEDLDVRNKYGESIGKFHQDIICAIRAGLDMAVPFEASSGVLGFTVGDIRKMFLEGIPDYVSLFIETQYSRPGSFTMLPCAKDETPLWL